MTMKITVTQVNKSHIQIVVCKEKEQDPKRYTQYIYIYIQFKVVKLELKAKKLLSLKSALKFPLLGMPGWLSVI